MDFKQHLLGGIEPSLFAACFVFSCLGILLILLAGTTVRDVHSPYSPKQFSWRYLWNDNLKRIVTNLIAVIVTLRFMPDLLGTELTQWKAFCVGMGWDMILLLIKQKTNILDPKK